MSNQGDTFVSESIFNHKPTHLFKEAQDAVSCSVIDVPSQPVFEALPVAQLHLNEQVCGWLCTGLRREVIYTIQEISV